MTKTCYMFRLPHPPPKKSIFTRKYQKYRDPNQVSYRVPLEWGTGLHDTRAHIYNILPEFRAISCFFSFLSHLQPIVSPWLKGPNTIQNKKISELRISLSCVHCCVNRSTQNGLRCSCAVRVDSLRGSSKSNPAFFRSSPKNRPWSPRGGVEV